MNAETRRAAFAQARAESLDALERIAEVTVEHRKHEDDGMLTSWSRGMPPKPPPPTIAEVRQEIADALAKQMSAPALTSNEIERMIDSTIVEYKLATRESLAILADEIFKRIATEARAIAKLRDEHDLRISALLQATEKLERGLGGGDVVDLPALPMRNRRAG